MTPRGSAPRARHPQRCRAAVPVDARHPRPWRADHGGPALQPVGPTWGEHPGAPEQGHLRRVALGDRPRSRPSHRALDVHDGPPRSPDGLADAQSLRRARGCPTSRCRELSGRRLHVHHRRSLTATCLRARHADGGRVCRFSTGGSSGPGGRPNVPAARSRQPRAERTRPSPGAIRRGCLRPRRWAIVAER